LTSQSPISLAPVQQFIFDCADLASNLDSLDRRDHRSYLLAAILSGKTQYHALALRRQDLSPSIVEEAWVDFLLEGLQTRLKFLETQVRASA
jgi:hypothetical protein